MLKNLISTITQRENINLTPIQFTSLQKDSPCCIFIADENKINELLLKNQLEPYCQNITTDLDGKSTFTYLKNEKYDLIFLDLQTPYLIGQNIVDCIKQPGSINYQTPLIAMTTGIPIQQRNLLINNTGYDDCIIKPIALEQLLELLQLWLPLPWPFPYNNCAASNYVEIMLDRLSGKSKLAKLIFIKLFSELLVQQKAIRNALKTNNLMLAETIVHKLHGSVGFCGFTDIQEIAEALETSFASNDSESISANFLSLSKKIAGFLLLKHEILILLE